MKPPDYSISTPENVDLHLELAGLGNRIWAAFIDMILVYLINIFVLLLAIAASILVQNLGIGKQEKILLYYYIVAVAVLGIFAVQVGYFIFFEKRWNGQTPGKRLTHIRVIESNGQAVNLHSIVIRNLMRFIDTGLMMLGVVFMIFDKNERRLGDMLGGTLVIKERKADLGASKLNIVSQDTNAATLDAGQINPSEYHLLLSFLKRRNEMAPSSRQKLARELEEYFRLKLDPGKPGENAELFLEELYLAYNALINLENS